MLALSLDDFTLLVVDIETRRVVRKFAGHHGNINDMVGSRHNQQPANNANRHLTAANSSANSLQL